MLNKTLACVVWIAATLSFASPANAFASSQPKQNFAQVEYFVDDAISAVNKGQLEQAHADFEQFHDAWFQFEDGVKSQSGQAYSDIESAMGQAEYAFMVNKPADASQALESLQATNRKFLQGQYATSGFQGQNVSLDDFIILLQHAKQEAQANRIAPAVADMDQVRQSWLSVEGTVVAQSQIVYDATERDIVTVNAMLHEQPANVTGAVKTLDEMVNSLSPLAVKNGYSIWDAAMIPIREGLEALLVVAALLAFTKKSSSSRGKKWVWSGVSGGLLISACLAVLVKFVFSSGAFGKNNFLISGWTGVIAAVMLLYMSYWLHSKSHISDWQNFIRNKTQAALSTGKLLSLGVLSFLAVFREGTETVLFIIGMVNQISLRNLIIGLVVGFAVLAAIGLFMLGVGLKLPIRAFFITSSVIVFYLCLKFTGMGIHSLQLAGLLPSTTANAIPNWSFLALYPSWQSVLPQIVLLVAAVVVVVWRRVTLKHQQLAVQNDAP